MAKASKTPVTESKTRKQSPSTKRVATIPTTRKVTTLSDAEKRRMIAEAAFYNSQKRAQLGGDPIQDWLLAEKQIEQQLSH